MYTHTHRKKHSQFPPVSGAQVLLIPILAIISIHNVFLGLFAVSMFYQFSIRVFHRQWNGLVRWCAPSKLAAETEAGDSRARGPREEKTSREKLAKIGNITEFHFRNHFTHGCQMEWRISSSFPPLRTHHRPLTVWVRSTYPITKLWSNGNF